VAAAGGHNLLMVGPPGVGKTMLARRMAAILPDLTEEEALIVTTIHSVAGLLPEGAGLVTARSFRAPHHTVSAAGLVGGGSVPRPGEVSLAHKGVLFLDELPEFRRDALEALRQPVEEGRVTITRSMSTVSFPSEFALVASMNPCPCGNLGHPRVPCRCTPAEIRRYLSKVSGPLLDRIDVRVSLGTPAFEELAGGPACDDTRGARERVLAARRVQEERAQSADPDRGGFAPVNARLHVAVLDDVVRMNPEAASCEARSGSSTCPRAPTTRCCESRGPSPTWRKRERWLPNTCPRPCSTGPIRGCRGPRAGAHAGHRGRQVHNSSKQLAAGQDYATRLQLRSKSSPQRREHPCRALSDTHWCAPS
jgi:predicted ATPase with chaperone activity